MYYYIYDNYLVEKKYQNTLSRVESQLTDLGINGKIVRMSVFKNLSSHLNDDIAKGIKTIVVVGNDQTLNQTLNLINNLNIPIGLIPIGSNNNKIAELFGIPEGEAACNIISSRNIRQIHLGIINQKYYFMSYLEMMGDGVYINCDDNYYINIEDKKDIITISNIYYGEYDGRINILSNAGYLNLIIKNKSGGLFSAKKENFSYFKAKKIFISGDKSIPILLMDEKKIIKTPIRVEIAKQKINLIVGKKRKI
ncbi:MAG: diacylglycerol kinase family protein [Candidatus Buchananbacteria bacterium]|jgi:diacylglycerol kinase family enzyme